MAKSIKSRELNLLLALEKNKGKASGKTELPGMLRLTILVFLLLLVATAGFGAFYFMTAAQLTDEITNSNELLTNPIYRDTFNKTEQARIEAAEMAAQAASITGTQANLKTYPDMKSSNWKKLFRIAGGRVELSGIAYDRRTGMLSFTATTATASRVSLFITELRASGIFNAVSYEGYSAVPRVIFGTPSTDGDGNVSVSSSTITEYSFNVKCLVKPPKQEEEAANG